MCVSTRFMNGFNELCDNYPDVGCCRSWKLFFTSPLQVVHAEIKNDFIYLKSTAVICRTGPTSWRKSFMLLYL